MLPIRTSALFEAVCERQAALIARWLHVGFIHGVMNTDNMTVSGETIDFGPCAFMDEYDPAMVFSSIDQNGRYAYASQPGIGQWNLARLGETLLPLIDADSDKAVEAANVVIKDYGERFQIHWLRGMREKIGLSSVEDDDLDLIQSLLSIMQAGTGGFHADLPAAVAPGGRRRHGSRNSWPPSGSRQAAKEWLSRWRQRLWREMTTDTARSAAMLSVNPAVIPRNHRIEQAIVAAVEEADFSLFEALLDALARPYEDHAEFTGYTQPPKAVRTGSQNLLRDVNRAPPPLP
jgi:uncharacterized protein YdiU (UPF0061 family)